MLRASRAPFLAMLSPTQREKLHAAGFVVLFFALVTLAIGASGMGEDRFPTPRSVPVSGGR